MTGNLIRCKHSDDGVCRDCVKELYDRHEKALRFLHEQSRRLNQQVVFWQGKHAMLRHENNALRKRVNTTQVASHVVTMIDNIPPWPSAHFGDPVETVVVYALPWTWHAPIMCGTTCELLHAAKEQACHDGDIRLAATILHLADSLESERAAT